MKKGKSRETKEKGIKWYGTDFSIKLMPTPLSEETKGASLTLVLWESSPFPPLVLRLQWEWPRPGRSSTISRDPKGRKTFRSRLRPQSDFGYTWLVIKMLSLVTVGH